MNEKNDQRPSWLNGGEEALAMAQEDAMNEQSGNSGQLQLAVARLERGYVTGIDEEWRDDLRVVLDALAARQPVGQEPVATYCGRRLTPEGTREYWGYLSDGIDDLPLGSKLYAAPPAPAAVPVDAAQILRDAAAVLLMWQDDPNLTGYLGDFGDACDILEILAGHATHPQPAAAKDGDA